MLELEVNFRPRGNSRRFVGAGWGDPEPFGRWMVGGESILVLPPPPRPVRSIELRAVVGPYLQMGAIPSLPFAIRVNGHEVLSTALDNVRELTCTVPGQAVAPGAALVVSFVHPGARSPHSLAGEGDMRALAASIWSLTLFADADPLPAPLAAPTDRLGPPPAPLDAPAAFNLFSRGNLANRMIQYMVGRSVQVASGCVLTGVELDEWGLAPTGERAGEQPGPPPDHVPDYIPDWADLVLLDEQRIDVAGVARQLAGGGVRKISWRGYGQRMENFLPRAEYVRSFRSDIADMTWFDERFLVINVRSGELVEGLIRDYVLTPAGFYRELIERTGLIPVFMGQVEPNAYTDLLRAAFPHAVFLPSQGPVRDFETVRRSKNIVPSVSTFSWLAAWLSDADRIFLPVNGMFNPLQFPPVDLLPLDDPRYVFTLFPVNHAVPGHDLAAAHRALEGRWQPITAEALGSLKQ